LAINTVATGIAYQCSYRCHDANGRLRDYLAEFFSALFKWS
jgi:hypothetical protein